MSVCFGCLRVALFALGELGDFRRAFQGHCRGRSAGNHVLNRVEVSGSDESLMLHRLVPMIVLALEFAVLQVRVGGHTLLPEAAGQLEH